MFLSVKLVSEAFCVGRVSISEQISAAPMDEILRSPRANRVWTLDSIRTCICKPHVSGGGATSALRFSGMRRSVGLFRASEKARRTCCDQECRDYSSQHRPCFGGERHSSHRRSWSRSSFTNPDRYRPEVIA